MFGLGVNGPEDRQRSIVNEHRDLEYGWHDQGNGVTYRTTRGNNVNAQENFSGTAAWVNNCRPTASGQDSFNCPINLAQDPRQYINAAISNLFVANNYIHNIFYQHGFNEESAFMKCTIDVHYFEECPDDNQVYMKLDEGEVWMVIVIIAITMLIVHFWPKIPKGFANFVSSLFSAMGGDAMIGQSTINVINDARGRLSGMAGWFLLSIIVGLHFIIQEIPIASLTGVLFMVVIHTFNWKTFEIIYRGSWKDGLVIILVTVLAVVFDLAIAVAAGVVVTSLFSAWQSGSSCGPGRCLKRTKMEAQIP